MARSSKKVFIAAGGTGGHVFPGIAVARELMRIDPSVEIKFAGTPRGLETEIVPGFGWPLILFGSHSIKDKGGAGKVAALVRLPFSVLHAIAVLISDRPDLVVGIGGYAAAPLIFAAWLLRIPIVLVEPNAIPGMTNRKLGRMAKRIFVAFDEAKGYFAKDKAVLTGAPIRTEVAEAVRGDGEASGLRTLFVFGGSQGARTLNLAMKSAAGELGNIGKGMRVIHQTGRSADPAEISGAYSDAGLKAEVMPFCDRIWDCYGKADLVVARAGANTVAELAAVGIPSILVPYPHAADDHQRANAMALVRAGAARLVDDSECTGERMAREIADLFGNPSRLQEMARGAKSVGHPDAARTIAKECMDIMKTDH